MLKKRIRVLKNGAILTLIAGLFLLTIPMIINPDQKNDPVFLTNEPNDSQYLTIDLYDAYWNYGGIQVQIQGTGSYYGACISFTFEWLSGWYSSYSTIEITLNLGRKLVPSSSSVQTMVIAHEYTITLDWEGDVDTYTAYAFCIEIHDDIPESYDSLTPSTKYSTTSNTYKLLSYAEANNYYSDHETQVALWVTTDGPSEVTSDYYYDSEVSTINMLLSNSGTGLSLQSNQDDSFEDNDQFSDAASVSTGYYTDLYVSEYDEDWYSISVSRGNIIKVNLEFTDDDGDIDLELYTSSNNEVASSTSSSDNELATYTASSTTTIYIRVFLYSGESNTYNMRITIESGGGLFTNPFGLPFIAGYDIFILLGAIG
ncbi:MAG: pre-peptidase C-terminal domain-containing protein, partial [Promethearchaeota archaeon]